jgi:hypothetical protein
MTSSLFRTSTPFLSVLRGVRRLSVTSSNNTSSSDNPEVAGTRKIIVVKKKWTKAAAIQKHLEDQMLFGDLLNTGAKKKKKGDSKKPSLKVKPSAKELSEEQNISHTVRFVRGFHKISPRLFIFLMEDLRNLISKCELVDCYQTF